MRSTYYLTWILILGILYMAVPLALATDRTTRQPPRAKIVTVEGAATTYKVEDMHGQTVTVDVPSQTMTDIKLSDPVQGTVRGTVVALDGESNRVKVHTQERQMVVLELPHETIMSMRLGDTFTLAVPRPAGR
jgi:hypothetical protein